MRLLGSLQCSPDPVAGFGGGRQVRKNGKGYGRKGSGRRYKKEGE